MAETLRNGVVVPLRTDRISTSGVDEIRALGASVASGLGAAAATANDAKTLVSTVDAQAKSRDTALEAQIAGMEGMRYVGAWTSGTTYRINDVVTHGGDSWARLTAGSTGEPGVSPADWGLVARKGDGGGFGALSETATTGLYQPVPDAGPGYDTGWRDITARMAEQPTAGALYLRREGRRAWVHAYGLAFARSASFIELAGLIPAGFRPARVTDVPMARRNSGDKAGAFRVNGDGRSYFYQVDSGLLIWGLASWLTDEPVPSALPGTPA